MNSNTLRNASAKKISNYEDYIDNISPEDIFSPLALKNFSILESEYRKLRLYWTSRRDIMGIPTIENAILKKIDFEYNEAKKRKTMRSSYQGEIDTNSQKIGILLDRKEFQESRANESKIRNLLSSYVFGFEKRVRKILFVLQPEIYKGLGSIHFSKESYKRIIIELNKRRQKNEELEKLLNEAKEYSEAEKQVITFIEMIRSGMGIYYPSLSILFKKDIPKEVIDELEEKEKTKGIRNSAIKEINDDSFGMLETLSLSNRAQIKKILIKIIEGTITLSSFGITDS